MDSNQTIVRYNTPSGVILPLSILSVADNRMLVERAEALYPRPNPKDYEMEYAPHEIQPAIEGDKKPGKDNPEYKRALVDAVNQQLLYVYRQAVMLAIDLSEAEQNALIQQFAPQLEKRKKAFGLEVAAGDEWEITLFHCIATGDETLQEMYELAMLRRPLEPEEVLDGIAFFRRKVEK